MRKGSDVRFARRLRRDATDAERLLWRHLRGKHLERSRFRRQVQIGPYFADFACIEAKVIVEVDGGQHNGRGSDAVRDRFLEEAGLTVVRVWNSDVMTNMEGVCEVILRALEAAASARSRPHPSPPPQAGEGV